MGFETIAFAAFAGLQAISKINAANSAAKQAIQAGNIAAEQSAIKTNYAASKQMASFLSSGISINEGTPKDVFAETFQTGIKDVNNIQNNARATAKNQIASGRSEAIGGLVSALAPGVMQGGSIGSMFESSGISDKIGFGLNNAGFGNDAYSFLEDQDNTYAASEIGKIK